MESTDLKLSKILPGPKMFVLLIMVVVATSNQNLQKEVLKLMLSSEMITLTKHEIERLYFGQKKP